MMKLAKKTTTADTTMGTRSDVSGTISTSNSDGEPGPMEHRLVYHEGYDPANRTPRDGDLTSLLFRVWIPFPHREGIPLRIDQHREPPHPWHCRARLHDFRAEILGALDGRIKRLDVDVVDPAGILEA